MRLGEWSDRGCSKNVSLSDSSVTVCECRHLAYFAILVSPPPRDVLKPIVTISMGVIDYACVAVSLVAMALTITTLSLLQ